MSDPNLTEFLAGTVGVVEANSFEVMCLWKEHKTRGTWVEHPLGMGCTVGHFGDMPVHVSLRTAEVDGHKILFIDPTSQVVDHRMVRDWLRSEMPKSAKCTATGAVNKVDAMNFHNVFPRERVSP
jgi:hypothetical protein